MGWQKRFGEKLSGKAAREQKEKRCSAGLANIKSELSGVGQLLSVHRPIRKLMTNARDTARNSRSLIGGGGSVAPPKI
jgi:hypothetical protein